jgi:DNA-binding transcriptional LysR family regulator
MVKVQQLRALSSIAQAGSFQEAARSLGLSQPAISKAILELERQLGAPVLVRSSRGVTLTELGRVVLKRANSIHREFEKLEEEVGFLRSKFAGKLAFGFTQLAGVPVLADAITLFRQRYPRVDLSVFELRPHEILEGVRTGAQDFGLITLYGATTLPGFETEVARSFDTVLISGAGHGGGPVSVRDLLDSEWLDADVGDMPAGYVATIMAGLDLPMPQRVIHCSSIHLAAQLAKRLGAICGMTRAALRFFEAEFRSGALRALEIDTELPKMHVALVYPNRDLLSPAAREMARLLRAAYAPALRQQGWEPAAIR